MSCCGDKRQKLYANPYAHGDTDEIPSRDHPGQPADGVWFEYTGNSTLTVKGVITGSLYRFRGKGALIEADRNDAAFMTGIPDLKIRHRGR
ncbi:MAG: hypothetical protein R6W71_07050 [Bacteroidales bacterium]